MKPVIQPMPNALRVFRHFTDAMERNTVHLAAVEEFVNLNHKSNNAQTRRHVPPFSQLEHTAPRV